MRRFYLRWVLANGWAEAFGLGGTFVIASLLVPVFEAQGVWVLLFGALVAVMLGTLLEGALVGMAQERVLRGALPTLPRGSWTLATALGAGLAWALGMVPSALIQLTGTGRPPAVEPGPLATFGLAAAMGVVVGPVLASAQWVVLHRDVRRSARWLWANAAAWAIGMPMVFAGMDMVPWNGSVQARVATLLLVCGAVGLAVGVVHGLVLVRLLRERSRTTVECAA
jgi:hypothetical protein